MLAGGKGHVSASVGMPDQQMGDDKDIAGQEQLYGVSALPPPDFSVLKSLYMGMPLFCFSTVTRQPLQGIELLSWCLQGVGLLSWCLQVCIKPPRIGDLGPAAIRMRG